MATQPSISTEITVTHTIPREDYNYVWPLPPRIRPPLGDFSAASLAEYLATAPIDTVDIADPMYWETDTNDVFFKRLRDEAPIHFTSLNNSRPRGYWSVTRWADIMAVDTNHAVFSSDAHLGGMTLFDMDQDFIMPMFIAMDQPKHDVQRKAVNPIVSGANLAAFEDLIRSRTQEVLDGLAVIEDVDQPDVLLHHQPPRLE